MKLAEKLLLGLNTTIICMGIVFLVLIILSWITVVQSKILNAVSKMAEAASVKHPEVQAQKAAVLQDGTNQKPVSESARKGTTKGEAKLVGVANEEEVAVIMAAVSNVSNVPLSALRIKSIRRVDDTWNVTAKQEQINQRL